jgi:hypothetical protein
MTNAHGFLDLLTPLVVSTSLGLMSALSARMRHRISGGVETYRYPAYMAWLGILACALSLWGAATCWRDGAIGIAIAGAISFLLMLIFSIYGFHFRAILTESGLTIGAFHRSHVPFGDIIDAEMREGARSRELVIFIRDGGRIRISGMLADFEDFVTKLRMHIPALKEPAVADALPRKDRIASRVYGGLALLIVVIFAVIFVWASRH